MPPSPPESRTPSRILQLQPVEASGISASPRRLDREETTTPRAARTNLIDLRATVLLAIAAYGLALAMSGLLHIRANALDGIPLCAGPAAFALFYSRLVFPRATRLKQGIETACLMVVL